MNVSFDFSLIESSEIYHQGEEEEVQVEEGRRMKKWGRTMKRGGSGGGEGEEGNCD